MKNYTIYINDNTLLIANKVPSHTEPVELVEENGFNFETFYEGLSKLSAKQYVLVTADPKSLFKQMKAGLTVIKAAGGLVMNAKDEYLFIFRNKKWDLPKGKVEKGEGIKDAGRREVEEECGVKINTNDERLCKTYHVYEMGTRLVLKRTNWYSMTVKGSPKLIPQKEEGITKAEWLTAADLKPVLKNTYPSIIDVLKAGKLIKEKVSKEKIKLP
ncbi:ADP-ribose pyrophosphatase YjhB (NUDIX family) [Pedobacter cryoconitis]|uniref:ADP-ribose pyrophosphatase YjhB (NUDIX family) n=1 Tax=Pedobacter cryoconitis TaxID=188932 RepID=A0A7W9DJU3_9SPHI|nr:NUDIX domain-containing protein [Pedobacter cryoconitis]MBB5621577.1 ADP-ribose pyrophosphatase YjhB (NUDIX family) [Pedobacter cryoconitis]MBB5643913.1 ADP-ribose pyrophosphatase YjhB (NUDIX family) [Pedobacter cryoconitis]